MTLLAAPPHTQHRYIGAPANVCDTKILARLDTMDRLHLGGRGIGILKTLSESGTLLERGEILTELDWPVREAHIAPTNAYTDHPAHEKGASS